jgi:hypothetical protein
MANLSARARGERDGTSGFGADDVAGADEVVVGDLPAARTPVMAIMRQMT